MEQYIYDTYDTQKNVSQALYTQPDWLLAWRLQIAINRQKIRRSPGFFLKNLIKDKLKSAKMIRETSTKGLMVNIK